LRAIILAAGRGERLRPLTDTTPKPLIDVGGRPLIHHHLSKLADAGITEVVINVAWLGQMIERALGTGDGFGLNIEYSREPAGALETAGGIIAALPLLGDNPFVMVSADVFCHYPLERLKNHAMKGLGHLIMVRNPAHHSEGDFAISPTGTLARAGSKLTFSGLAVLRPQLFAGWAPGRRPLRPVLEKALEHQTLTGELYDGLWSDVGTPERLADIRAQLRA
jgi:MurNAc alpha-1-phosphate uridylyltransferase